jgi:CO dehydrogenase/acetyl-CoA synthase alpha subunit
MALEQEFLEAELKRQRAEENKIRKNMGLPSVEQEEIMQKEALIEKDKKEKETLKEAIQNTVVQIEKLQSELATLKVKQDQTVESQDQLMQRINDVEQNLKQRIDAIIELKRDELELMKKTLGKLNQYLDDWL